MTQLNKNIAPFFRPTYRLERESTKSVPLLRLPKQLFDLLAAPLRLLMQKTLVPACARDCDFDPSGATLSSIGSKLLKLAFALTSIPFALTFRLTIFSTIARSTVSSNSFSNTPERSSHRGAGNSCSGEIDGRAIGVAHHGGIRSLPTEVCTKDRKYLSIFDMNRALPAACQP